MRVVTQPERAEACKQSGHSGASNCRLTRTAALGDRLQRMNVPCVTLHIPLLRALMGA